MTNAEEKARAARRAYYKEWRAKNKDKVKVNNMRYWARRAEREAQSSAKEGGNDNAASTAIPENR